jgi:hypothetical protein
VSQVAWKSSRIDHTHYFMEEFATANPTVDTRRTETRLATDRESSLWHSSVIDCYCCRLIYLPVTFCQTGVEIRIACSWLQVLVYTG